MTNRAMRNGSTALILSGLLSIGSAAIAGSPKAAGSTSKPASAPKSSAASRPASTSKSAGGAVHGPAANGTGSHGPTANGTGTANTHGPSANGSNTQATPNSRYGQPASSAGAHAAIQAGHNQAIPHASPAGSVDHATRNGSAIRTRPNGKVSDVHDAR